MDFIFDNYEFYIFILCLIFFSDINKFNYKIVIS